MRLLFFADNSNNPWGIHAFGNSDWKKSAAPEYWYYYQQGNEKYPTTTGLSVQSVSDILIYSRSTIQGESTRKASITPPAAPTQAGISSVTTICSLGTCCMAGYLLQKRG
jgi:hypothetical protein